jgi:cytoskeletal protein RodZ
MIMPGSFAKGAIRLGLADIVTALILLALLLWVSYRQFPAYQNKFAPTPSVHSQAAPDKNRTAPAASAATGSMATSRASR